MWLINCSNYRLEPNDLESSQPKPYWILSHTWGDGEVTFQDMQSPRPATGKKGFRKIQSMCKLALAGGIKYVWIDTCCIDKTSSAELSESINSMFYWYKKSERCIAFLEDLRPGVGSATEDGLRGCRWFTRGWTLQELVAPTEVVFYDSRWKSRGTKKELCQVLSNITNIRYDVLVHPSGTNDGILHTVSVATKMSWAAGRQTTRIEDKAYCLLGIFDVHMPLLYGERGQAFIRLQQAIAQKDNDMSLFAWIAPRDDQLLPLSSTHSGLLATDPSHFAAGLEIVPIRDPLLPVSSWIITNVGIETTTALGRSVGSGSAPTILTRQSDGTVTTKNDLAESPSSYRLFLHCRIKDPAQTEGSKEPLGLAIWLQKLSWGYVRFRPTELCSIRRSAMGFGDPNCIRILMSLSTHQKQDALELLSYLQDNNNIVPSTMKVRLDLRCCDADIKSTRHPAHLWEGDRLSFPRWVDSPLSGNLAIGLVEIALSNRAGDAPFSQTFWVFFGMLSTPSWEDKSAYFQTPWVEVVPEESHGRVPIFGKQAVCRPEDLRNPFALSSLLGRLQAQGVRPEFAPLQTECIVRCSPVLHLRFRAHGYKLRPRSQPPAVLIQGESFDPTADDSS